MIEEHALVVALDGDDVWVETQRQSACGQCAANKGCGTAVLGKVLGLKRSRVRILNPNATSVSVGDEIIVGIEEQALVRGSLAIYTVPLMTLFLFGVLGDVLAGQLNISDSDFFVSVFGFIGLFFGFFWLRWFSRKMSRDSRYQPVLLQRVIQHQVARTWSN